jgi:hypothetical protein
MYMFRYRSIAVVRFEKQLMENSIFGYNYNLHATYSIPTTPPVCNAIQPFNVKAHHMAIIVNHGLYIKMQFR